VSSPAVVLPTPLDRAMERVLTGGLLASAALLLAGLLLGQVGLLRAGLVLLMLTPVARVVVLTAGLLRQRDLAFGLISLWILCVLLSGLYMAFFVEGRRAPQPAPAAPRAIGP
jgi:uncharacterized membrane protein